jgi:hypothetical protein
MNGETDMPDIESAMELQIRIHCKFWVSVSTKELRAWKSAIFIQCRSQVSSMQLAMFFYMNTQDDTAPSIDDTWEAALCNRSREAYVSFSQFTANLLYFRRT